MRTSPQPFNPDNTNRIVHNGRCHPVNRHGDLVTVGYRTERRIDCWQQPIKCRRPLTTTQRSIPLSAQTISAPATRGVLDDLLTERRADVASSRLLDEALQRHKREGLQLAVRARWIALAAIGGLLIYLTPEWSVLYYLGILVLFGLIGWAQSHVGSYGRSRRELALIFADLALLTLTLIVPNPFRQEPWPLAIQFRFDGILYYFVFLAVAALSCSWGWIHSTRSAGTTSSRRLLVASSPRRFCSNAAISTMT